MVCLTFADRAETGDRDSDEEEAGSGNVEFAMSLRG
jgi:hypothetical protein